MLTPALRVVSPEPEPVSAAPDLFDAPFRAAAAPLPLPDVFPERDAMALGPDLSLLLSAAQQPRFGDFGFAEAIEEAIDSGEGLQALLDDPANALVGDAAFAADEPEDAPAAPGIETVVVALGAAVAAQPGEWEPDGGDPQPAAADWPGGDWMTPQDTDSDGMAQLAGPADQNRVADDGNQWAAEAVWAQEDDTPESHIIDMTTRLPAVPEVWDEEQQRIADLAEAAAVAEIMAAAVPTPARALPDDEDDSALFDEEVLRDLVRDIIREELQGTLGERITRNVRKLVRAEISRALASRDFD